MTTYAFDIDGTLTREEIKILAKDLYDAGHKILVLTGSLIKFSEIDRIEEKRKKAVVRRKKQLEELQVKYHEVYVGIGMTSGEVAEQKAEVCREHKPVLIFEDTPQYIDIIEKHSRTVGLLVKKNRMHN